MFIYYHLSLFYRDNIENTFVSSVNFYFKYAVLEI